MRCPTPGCAGRTGAHPICDACWAELTPATRRKLFRSFQAVDAVKARPHKLAELLRATDPAIAALREAAEELAE